MDKELRYKISCIDAAIRKHRALAMWGNVESKMRLKELKERKKELICNY